MPRVQVVTNIQKQCRIWFARPGTQILGGVKNQQRLRDLLSRSQWIISLVTNASYLQHSDKEHYDQLKLFIDNLSAAFPARFFHVDIANLQVVKCPNKQVEESDHQKETIDYVKDELAKWGKSSDLKESTNPAALSDIVRVMPWVLLNCGFYFDFDAIFEDFLPLTAELPFELAHEVDPAFENSPFLLALMAISASNMMVNNNIICFADPFHDVLTRFRNHIYHRVVEKHEVVTQDNISLCTGPSVFHFCAVSFLKTQTQDRLVFAYEELNQSGLEFLVANVNFWGVFSKSAGVSLQLLPYTKCGDCSWMSDAERRHSEWQQAVNRFQLNEWLKVLLSGAPIPPVLLSSAPNSLLKRPRPPDQPDQPDQPDEPPYKRKLPFGNQS